MTHLILNLIFTSICPSLRAMISLNFAGMRHKIPKAESCQYNGKKHYKHYKETAV